MERQLEDQNKSHVVHLLLHEYNNAVQLYANTISVTYMRVYGFLAVHGGLIVGFFLVTEQVPRFIISFMGLVFALFTFLAVEHVCQFSKLRLYQARELEEQLNRLIKTYMEFEFTTFNNQKILFIDNEQVRFRLTDKELPESKCARCLIKLLPYQADKIVTIPLCIWWVALISYVLFTGSYI